MLKRELVSPGPDICVCVCCKGVLYCIVLYCTVLYFVFCIRCNDVLLLVSVIHLHVCS